MTAAGRGKPTVTVLGVPLGIYRWLTTMVFIRFGGNHEDALLSVYEDSEGRPNRWLNTMLFPSVPTGGSTKTRAIFQSLERGSIPRATFYLCVFNILTYVGLLATFPACHQAENPLPDSKNSLISNVPLPALS